jgi:serine/threonine-protein kinase SRPK3
MMMAPHFIPSHLDAIEDIEDYQPSGYHPISVGNTFDHGRFRILHKLGFGGSSTVWLACDQREEGDRSRIVTLKAMHTNIPSSKVLSKIPELAISQKLKASLPPSESVDFQTVNHHFFVQGPNSSHLFLIFPLAGPSILALSDSPGRAAGSRQLHADLARKVTKQTAMMMHHMLISDLHALSGSYGLRDICYVTAGTFTRLGLCRLPYDKALVSRVLSISHDK